MTFRIGLSTTLGLLLAAGTALGQQSTPNPRPPARPNQPVVPRVPTLQRRAGAPQPPGAPFRLTAQQEDYLNRVLYAWEQRSAKVQTFACKFTRWEYDPVFGDPDTFRYRDEGEIRYGAPDRGMFRIWKSEKKEENGQMVPAGEDRGEHWVSNGKSVFEYNYAKKRLVEYKLPPSLQGKAIADGPLPFLFGAEAAKLKERYFLRITTPQVVQDKEIWLQAYPRFQQDAANFERAELILTRNDMRPFALQIFLPGGNSHTSYQFHGIVINDPLNFLKGNPFHAPTPLGWKKIVEEPHAEQASRPPAVDGRR